MKRLFALLLLCCVGCQQPAQLDDYRDEAAVDMAIVILAVKETPTPPQAPDDAGADAPVDTTIPLLDAVEGDGEIAIDVPPPSNCPGGVCPVPTQKPTVTTRRVLFPRLFGRSRR